MEHPIRAAAVQFEHMAGDKKANMRKIDDFLARAHEKKADVVVFPECCITGYRFLRLLGGRELLELAEPVFDGASSRALLERARNYGMAIGAGLVEVDETEDRWTRVGSDGSGGGVGADDDEIRTGNSMIIDPYGRILAETRKAGDDMVVADLDTSLLVENTGQRWIRTRRPELYGPLAVRTGLERDTRSVRFDAKGV